MEISDIRLRGVQGMAPPETRALLLLDVDYNNQTYQWDIFLPPGADLQEFLATCAPLVKSQIDAREQEWAALAPKYREIPNPMGGGTTQVPITREEIVRPYVPDYYAQRRDAYPSLGDQLDAFWKGPAHPDYQAMMERIQQVKQSFPKI